MKKNASYWVKPASILGPWLLSAVFGHCFCSPAGRGGGLTVSDAAISKAVSQGKCAVGEVSRATGPFASGNPLQSSTKYHDDETELLYYGFRYYSASTGRWLSRDPLGDSRVDQVARPGKSSMASAIKPVAQRGHNTLNLYAFVGNNPATKTDYLGLDVNSPPATVSAQVACCKCGLSVDGYVAQTLNNITRAFRSADYLTKCAACNDLWIPDSPGYVIDAWDMLTVQNGVTTFSQPTHCQPCGRRLTFRGGCYAPEDVNYIMWGHITALCREELEVDWNATTVAMAVRAVKAVRGDPVGCAEAFALAGFDGRPLSCPQANWNKVCTPNPERFTTGDPNKWGWEPLRHRNSR